MNRIDKYVVVLAVISIMVAFLTHFPELISLFDHSGENNLFPGMHWADVANEIFFTFISLLLLFALNTFVFRFNRPSSVITWKKIVLSFIMTWIVSNVLGKGFVFLHHHFDIPAIDAMVTHYSLNTFSEIQFYKLSLYISYLQIFSFGLHTHKISRV